MSSSSILNRTEEFFNRLEAALGRPSPQNRDVVAEVRGGLFRAGGSAAAGWDGGRRGGGQRVGSDVVGEQGPSMPKRGPIKELGLDGSDRFMGTYALSKDGKEFTMWWPRPLSTNSSICYSSEDGRIWVND